MSPKVSEIYQNLKTFMEEKVIPAEDDCRDELIRNTAEGKRWTPLQTMHKLKLEAKALGLWNFFLPEASGGPGLTNFEYSPLCELMGRSHIAPEIFNCNAPDTGNPSARNLALGSHIHEDFAKRTSRVLMYAPAFLRPTTFRPLGCVTFL